MFFFSYLDELPDISYMSGKFDMTSNRNILWRLIPNKLNVFFRKIKDDIF
jgi:hypothetical protein